ncbi:hypothetical protein BURKHO8Y_210202 [Burkholderia sp. 8Y]|nr:hypothetical protein BURKHO8Y_210202 [Burkholderia sp. 8Y]
MTTCGYISRPSFRRPAYVITRVKVTGIVMDAFAAKDRRGASLRRNAGAVCATERDTYACGAKRQKKAPARGAFLVDCLMAGRRGSSSARMRRQ